MRRGAVYVTSMGHEFGERAALTGVMNFALFGKASLKCIGADPAILESILAK